MPIQWTDLEPGSSSMFDAISHDPNTNELHVRFKSGKVYTHGGVSADDHQALMTADSLGRHYNMFIKGKKPHVVVDEEFRQSER